VVIDATFLDQARRRQFHDLADEARAAFEVVSCVVPAQVLRERIERRLRKGGDASDAGIDVLERQLQRHDPLDGEEMVHATLLDTTHESEWHGAVSSLARRFRMPLAPA
jgi:predicted kinase